MRSVRPVRDLSRHDVIRFRLRAHHLYERVDPSLLPDVAGRCGVQNSPPGSALLALHARVRDLTAERLERAIAVDRTLLSSWCMRGAPFHFPTSDAPVFTTGLLPPTEEALRGFLPGVVPAVDRLGMSLTEAVDRVAAEIRAVLTGRRLAVNVLGAELATRIAATLPPGRRDVWEAEGPYAAGQPLGEGIVHFVIRILTLRGVVCFAPRTGTTAPFTLVDEWLGHTFPVVDPDVARAELLRRYLRGYGPSVPAHFAEWAGIHARDAGTWWTLLRDELTPVAFRGTAWMLTDDLDALDATPPPEGVRLLPPRDPYTQMRDRETIVDPAHHRTLGRTTGEPGTVLIDGEVAGTWRPRKRGRRLTVTVTPFTPLPDTRREALQEEAEMIGPLRGATSVEVVLDG